MAHPQRVAVTYDVYRTLPEDGSRYEVLEGDLVMSPAPRPRHQRVLRRLLRLLDDFLCSRDLGEVFCAPIDVILSPETIVQPDLLVIERSRIQTLVGETGIHGAPDLIVEILSPGTRDRDRLAKRQIYARFQVREYWLVDPESRTITILTLNSGELEQVVAASGDQPLFSTLFPALSVIPAKILAGD